MSIFDIAPDIPMPAPPQPPPGFKPINMNVNAYRGGITNAHLQVDKLTQKIFTHKIRKTKPKRITLDFFKRQEEAIEKSKRVKTPPQILEKPQKRQQSAPVKEENIEKLEMTNSVVSKPAEPIVEEIENNQIEIQEPQTKEETKIELEKETIEPKVEQTELETKESEIQELESLEAQKQKLEAIYMNLVKKNKPLQKKSEDQEFDELMAFVDQLPEEDEEVEVKVELDKLKQKIDEIYAKQNKFVEKKAVCTMEETQTQKETQKEIQKEKEPVQEIQFTNTMYDLQKMVYVDEIEDQSQRILREVKERQTQLRKNAPFLQPFVYRMK